MFLAFAVKAQTVVLRHNYYTEVYDTVLRAPIYNWYTLTIGHLQKNVKRTSTFYKDPMVPEKLQGGNGAYKGNGKYDKGHLAPAADFCFNTTAYRESMFYTNTAPQVDYFNEHLWESVEEAVRDSCRKYGKVKVYTGCVYGKERLRGIAIPSAYWKVIVYGQNQMAGWWSVNAITGNKKPESIMRSPDAISREVNVVFRP